MTSNTNLEGILQYAVDQLVIERDELRAEVERLRADLGTWGRIWNDAEMLTARAEALRDGTADLGHHKDD